MWFIFFYWTELYCLHLYVEVQDNACQIPSDIFTTYIFFVDM